MYCKRLRNDGALNYVQFFSGPLCILRSTHWQEYRHDVPGRELSASWRCTQQPLSATSRRHETALRHSGTGPAGVMQLVSRRCTHIHSTLTRAASPAATSALDCRRKITAERNQLSSVAHQAAYTVISRTSVHWINTSTGRDLI